MQLYPPVAANSKEALNDDVLSNETVVKKEMRVTYTPQAMGRLETLWGSDSAEQCPFVWLLLI
jgi:cytochrome P450